MTMLRGNQSGAPNIGKHGARDLVEQPRTDEIQPGHADDIAALEFGEKTHVVTL